MTALVDDHILLATFLHPDARSPVDGPIATTGLWYHRLGRALLASSVTGSMSRQLGGIPETDAARAIASVTTLPDQVGLVSLRELAVPMAHLLASGLRLNLLSLEVLAAAEHLGARICLGRADANPPLVAAAEGRGITVELVPT